MTILDATHKLFDYFSNKHSFSIDEDFKEVVPISENEPLERAAMELALKDMETNEIVKSTKVNEKECYILRRPLESFDQSVTVTHTTAYMIAEALNEFCQSIDDYTDAASVNNIEEKDLRNIIVLNQHYKTQLTKLMQESADDNNSGKDFGDNINFDNI